MSDKDGFTLSAMDFAFGPGGFHRPECVLAGASGTLWASDQFSGVRRLARNGTPELIGGNPARPDRFKVNGFALRRDGTIVFANLGPDGGIWQIARDGEVTPFLIRVDGIDLPAVNFVWADHRDRLWFCVSTMRSRALPFSASEADGFVGVVENGVARIAADGFVATNECRISPDGQGFYVNETFGKRTNRFDLAEDGSLSNRRVIAEYGPGTFPDGMAFDAEGGLWVVSVVSNRIFRIGPDGQSRLIFEDFDPAHVAEVERRLAAGTLDGPFVYERHSSVLLNTSSIAFGENDLRTAHLGCIGGERLASFRSPFAGDPQAHWTWA